jgi:hypothetical protein
VEGIEVIVLAYSLLAAMLAALMLLPAIWSHIADALLWAAVQAKAVEMTLAAVPDTFRQMRDVAERRVRDVA